MSNSKSENNDRFIIVTGRFGSPIKETAQVLAKAENLQLIDLNRDIETREQWTIRRLVMMNGEHALRNKEYEILKEIHEAIEGGQLAGAVVACSDGVLYDEDSAEIISKGRISFAGRDMSEDELWEKASKMEDTYHAFMIMETGENRRKKFSELVARQGELLTEGAERITMYYAKEEN